MASSVLPTAAQLATLTDLNAVVQWAGVSQEAWTAFQTAVGTLPTLRIFSGLSETAFKAVLRQARIAVSGGTPREFNAVEAIQLALAWRIARQAFSLPDLDPLADPPAAVAPAPGAAPLTTQKKIKTSSVLDQLDESEVPTMSQTEIDEAYRNHVEITGADPPADAEPTGEQIAALHARVVVRGEAPYADFSVLTPFGRRVQKQMKARVWMLQKDGSWKAADIPGPPTYETWAACWKVFRAALFMLRYPVPPNGTEAPKVVTSACLEEYFEKVSKLHGEFPETWHLLLQAEDRCRAEMFERYRRQLTKAALEGKLPMGLSFDARTPWIGVFTHAARDASFWDEHVVRPSQNFIARGGKHMSSDRASRTNLPEAAQDILETNAAAIGRETPAPPLPGMGSSRHAKKRRRIQEEKRASSQVSSAASGKGAGSGGGSGGTPRREPFMKSKGGLYLTNSDGVELCFRYAKGTAGSCPEPCRDFRDHGCQLCLGRHPNSQCPRSQNKTEGKTEGGGGKGKWSK